MHRPQPPTYLLAALVAVVALHALFKRAGTAVQPLRDSAELVRSGPYRLSRHPMYLGMVAITLGAALLAGSLAPLTAPVALWWVLDRHFARPEERDMRRQFGTRYEAYCREVRRWLGRRSPRDGVT